LKIDHNSFDKPASIELVGTGIVKVSYDANRKVTKTESENPQVATQISAMFNTFLDAISGAE
jgi:hypothetical protein